MNLSFQIKYTSILFLLVWTSFALLACQSEYQKRDQEPNETSNVAQQDLSVSLDQLCNTNVNFEQVNKLVFSRYCVSCHQNSDPILVGYSDYKNNAAKIIEQVVVLKKMPNRGKLAEYEIDLVKKWYDNGAPEKGSGNSNVDDNNSIPIGGPITFTKLNTVFYEAKCSICHFPQNKDNLEDYSSYKKFRDNIGTILATTNIYVTMPPGPNEDSIGPKNPNQLSRAEKDLINRWILDGQLE